MQFEAIYREHFASIWRAVQRFGVPPRDAADAAQDVFVIAYRRRGEFEGRSSLKTWLIGISFRVAIARNRRVAAQRESLGDEALGRADIGNDPSPALERRELLSLLDRALERLPFAQRAVFTLFELEGLSGEEIASALKLPVGTVRSRLRLGREAFARAVRELGGDWGGHPVARKTGEGA